MRIAKDSWHAKVYRQLEFDYEPSVCKYFAVVGLLAPALCIVVVLLSPIIALAFGVSKGLDCWEKRWHLPKLKLRIPACPLGAVEFTEADSKQDLTPESAR